MQLYDSVSLYPGNMRGIFPHPTTLEKSVPSQIFHIDEHISAELLPVHLGIVTVVASGLQPEVLRFCPWLRLRLSL